MKTPRIPRNRKQTHSPEPDSAPIVRQGPTLERLLKLYKLDQVAEAEEMVEYVVRRWPDTDAAATSLLVRGLERKARGDRAGALSDLERAADASTHPDALTAAYKAGSLASLEDDAVTATRMYLKVAAKWPGTRSAASAAGALIELEPDRTAHWTAVWLATLKAIADQPVSGSSDDLEALEDLARYHWDHLDPAALDAVQAAAYARELLRRATARGDVEYAKAAEVILIAIETGRRRTDVMKFVAVGCDPRVDRRTLE